jgi:hypothetical protein
LQTLGLEYTLPLDAVKEWSDFDYMEGLAQGLPAPALGAFSGLDCFILLRPLLLLFTNQFLFFWNVHSG